MLLAEALVHVRRVECFILSWGEKYCSDTKISELMDSPGGPMASASALDRLLRSDESRQLLGSIYASIIVCGLPQLIRLPVESCTHLEMILLDRLQEVEREVVMHFEAKGHAVS